ncbi:MAG: hypothetical protein GX421_02735 [Caldisericales bacterium]|nr:hypothetical protein [Caldisericales bacterium]
MKRQYWTDPERLDYEVDLIPIGGNEFIMEPVVFHPDEGGQPPDRGIVDDANVLDVQFKNGKVCVKLDKDLAPGKHTARVDAHTRIENSRQHTAQHIISAIAERVYKSPTHGFHIGDTVSTLDLKNPINIIQVEDVEMQANRIVMMDVQIKTTFGAPDDGTRVREDLLGDKKDELRIVSIGDIDTSACCGTHCVSTGKVGPIKIISIEGHKGGTRVVYLAGERCIDHFQRQDRIIRQLREISTTGTEELPQAFQKYIDQAQSFQKELSRLWEVLLPTEAEKAEKYQTRFGEMAMLKTDTPLKLLGKLSAIVANKTKLPVIVFNGTHPQQVSVVSQNGNAKEVISAIVASFDGKGGGSPNSASGQMGRQADIDGIIKCLS